MSGRKQGSSRQSEPFQVYKILHQLVPVYLRDMLTYSANVTGHRLFIPRMWTTYGQRSLFYRGAVAWNNINIYSANSLNYYISHCIANYLLIVCCML